VASNPNLRLVLGEPFRVWDGMHPTYCGQQLMADEWIRTVQEFWRR
jgi:lysophospholipase L1-like esterase